jgi:uncharacterized RDD family membrane protein YckC
VIDAVVWLVVFFAVNGAGYMLAQAFGFTEETGGVPLSPGTTNEEMTPVASWVTLVALVAVLWAVEVPATAKSGSHFAKRRLRLLVVGPEGQPPGLKRASLRWFAAWAPAFACFALWGATVDSNWSWLFLGGELAALLIPGAMFFDSRNRGLHDRIAGTRVLAER